MSRLAEELAEHALVGERYIREKHQTADVCKCGSLHPQFEGGRWPTHRAHVAAALVAADEPEAVDVALTEDVWDQIVAVLCNCGAFDGHPGDCAATPVINLAARLAAHPVPAPEPRGEAEVKAEALREAAGEMPTGSGNHVSYWDGAAVNYRLYEDSPNDRTPQRWLYDRADRILRDAQAGEGGGAG